MIISGYINKQGDKISLTVDFDANYFPDKYIVNYNGTKTYFPGTKEGAADANRYYENNVSICDKRNISAEPQNEAEVP